MKKFTLFMSMAAAMISFAGCQKNEIEGAENTISGGTTFELVADIAQTKTTLNGLEVNWEEGDKIYMVTSDGTWGKAYADDNSGATIADFTYSDGKFTTPATIADGTYTFKAIYASASQRSYHRGDATSHKLDAVQNQNCTDPTAHIKLNDALVGTFQATLPATETARISMSHLYTMMQVNVTNNTGDAIQVTEFKMTAAGADLAGVFNVDGFDTPAISTKSGASSSITVKVTGGNVADEAALPVYFVMAPLKNWSGDVTFQVKDASGKTYTKTVAKTDLTFEAGKYNTTAYSIAEADKVAPNVSWDLTAKNAYASASADEVTYTSAHADVKVVKGSSQTNANNYLPTDANTYVHSRFYKDHKMTFTPAAGCTMTRIEVTCTNTTQSGNLSDDVWTNASVSKSDNIVTAVPEDGTAAVSVVFGASTQLTGIKIFFTDGGQTPDPEPEPEEPENPQPEDTNITIAEFLKLTEANATTVYTVTGTIVGISEISASFGNANLTISDGTDELYIYRMKPAAGGAAIDQIGLSIGDELTVAGKWATYNGSVQMAEGVYVSHVDKEAPEVTIPTVTIPEFNDKAVSTANFYQVTGRIVSIGEIATSYNNANLTISDGTNDLYIYRMKPGEAGQIGEIGLSVGDELTVIGNRGVYNNAIQMTNGYYVSHKDACETPSIACSNNTVTITCPTAGATIHYAIGNGAYSAYTGPVTITETCNVKAYASMNGMLDSFTAEQTCAVSSGDQTETVVLYESFDSCAGKGGNDGVWSGDVANGTFKSDLTWTTVKSYAANKCAKFGTSSAQGSATTPALNQSGDMVLTFKASAWAGDKTTLNLAITGGGTLSQTSVTLKSGAWSEYTIAITGATASTTISFNGYQKSKARFFLDEVKIVK